MQPELTVFSPVRRHVTEPCVISVAGPYAHLYNGNAHCLPAFDELYESQQHSEVPLTLLSAQNDESDLEGAASSDVPAEPSFDIAKLHPVGSEVERHVDWEDEVPQTPGSLEEP